MRKFTFLFIMLILLLFSFSYAALEVNSPNIALIDASNGRVLFERDAFIKTYPASTTKIMTAILTLENCKLDEGVLASENAINLVPSGGSTARIVAGETHTVEDLLKALLVASANEAANILAEHVAGDIDSFVDMMNKKAIEIGCKNTHFVNPNGLHDDNHYSCAYDIALMYKYAYTKLPTFKNFSSLTSFRLPTTSLYPEDDRTFKTSNKLLLTTKSNDGHLYFYEYCDGGKTGYTSQAKNCLVASATKSNVSLICCILGATQSQDNLSYRFQDAINLFDYGFERVTRRIIIPSGDTVATIPVENSKNSNDILEIGTMYELIANVDSDFSKEEAISSITYSGDFEAPINEGDILGNATYTIYDETFTIPLVAKNSIEKRPAFTFLDFLSGLIIWSLRILIILIILAIIRKITNKNSKKQHLARVKRYNQRFRR